LFLCVWGFVCVCVGLCFCVFILCFFFFFFGAHVSNVFLCVLVGLRADKPERKPHGMRRSEVKSGNGGICV